MKSINKLHSLQGGPKAQYCANGSEKYQTPVAKFQA